MNKIIKQLNWKKSLGLVPAIVQDFDTGTVLMLGYINKTALKKTLATKTVWFYSRSKKRLWQKGETSGNYLLVKNISIDCDSDALLIQVKPVGPTCHSGQYSCFGENRNSDAITSLFSLIRDRKLNMPDNSYTSYLFKKGVNKICSKVKEESAEVVYAVQKQTKKRLIEESVDLIYHWLVLIVQKNISLGDISSEIIKRRK